ncbi:MAG: CarD family transcriptional regulator [Candidatus Aminicenantaceae bacterium]
MNVLKIGDKVIYPNQGLGIIENIQEENYFGQDFQIYHVRILANDTLVLVPFSNAEEIGIRKPISEESIQDIFDFIRNGGVDVTMNWKGRYKEHIDLMKSGTIQDMALVLKSLYYLQLIKPLSFREKKMMEKAKDLIVTEISEVSSSPFEEIEVQVLEMLSNCFEDSIPHVDS